MASFSSFELVGPIKRGRPSSFDWDTAREICERLWEGESLSEICRDEDMPALRTVYQWMDAHEDFARDYAAARERQAFTHADQLMAVAFDPGILPDHKRVMVDALKWRAARQNWRAWGDRVNHQHEHAVKAEPIAAGGLPESLSFLDTSGEGHENERGPLDSEMGPG